MKSLFLHGYDVIILLCRIHENVSSLASTKNEHIYTIFKVEIALINYTMAVINRLCDINQITQPENWNIEDLHLDDYTSPEECQENFAVNKSTHLIKNHNYYFVFFCRNCMTSLF